MPTLGRLIDCIEALCRARGLEASSAQWSEIALAVRREYPGERVYIPPADSRKDPARRAAIAEAAKKLPTGVAASRFGVSKAYVRKITTNK